MPADVKPTKLSAHKGATALYQQVKDYILGHIASGHWLPDSRVPSENELVAVLGVSRMTVNRALRELSDGGHLVRLQGVGTFVARRKFESALLEVRNIADEIRERGGVHSSKLCLLAEERAAVDLAAAMELPPGTTVFHSILVHMDRGRPVQLAERFVNPRVAPDYLKQDFTQTTPSEYLFSVVPMSEVEHIVEAVLPDRVTQKLLKIGPQEPCLVLHRRTWSDGVFVHKGQFVHPGSRHSIGSRFKPAADVKPGGGPRNSANG